MLAVEIEQGLSEAWERVAIFVPKLLGFIAILVIGYFVAKLVARVVDGLLERVGFDGWVERGSFGEAIARSKFDASDILATVAFWTVFLLALQLRSEEHTSELQSLAYLVCRLLLEKKKKKIKLN